ncbi:hypothetical protein Aduo_005882 [Ancylostoma duodenale]
MSPIALNSNKYGRPWIPAGNRRFFQEHDISFVIIDYIPGAQIYIRLFFPAQRLPNFSQLSFLMKRFPRKLLLSPSDLFRNIFAFQR